MPVVGFDLGGTLVDEMPPRLAPPSAALCSRLKIEAGQLTQRLFEVMNLLIQEGERAADDQRSSTAIVEKYLVDSRLPISLDDFEDAAWEFIGVPDSEYLAPREGADKLLRELTHRGVTVVALSNTNLPHRIVERCLKANGLGQYFHAVALSSECGWRKPSTEAFRLLTRLAGMDDDDRFCYVGDTYNLDIVPVRKLGHYAIWITDADDMPDSAAPVVVARNLTEVERELVAWLSRETIDV